MVGRFPRVLLAIPSRNSFWCTQHISWCPSACDHLETALPGISAKIPVIIHSCSTAYLSDYVSLQCLYRIFIILNRVFMSTAGLSVILTFSQDTEVGYSFLYPDRKQSALNVATATFMSFVLSGSQTWRPPPTGCQYNKTKYSINVSVF